MLPCVSTSKPSKGWEALTMPSMVRLAGALSRVMEMVDCCKGSSQPLLHRVMKYWRIHRN